MASRCLVDSVVRRMDGDTVTHAFDITACGFSSVIGWRLKVLSLARVAAVDCCGWSRRYRCLLLVRHVDSFPIAGCRGSGFGASHASRGMPGSARMRYGLTGMGGGERGVARGLLFG